ncbi:MAG: TlpA disulfide reductase family protein [Steroidobacteraceae bacterium]
MIRSQLTAMLGTLLLGGLLPLAVAAPDAGEAAPDFALPGYTGSNVRLSEYRGEVVVLTFWSSRCGQCAQQLAALDQLQSTYRSAGLVTLAVGIDDDETRAAEFARSHDWRIPLLKDRDKQVGRAYGVDRLPTTVLIDRSGHVRYRFRDYRSTQSDYLMQLRALLDDSDAGK